VSDLAPPKRFSFTRLRKALIQGIEGRKQLDTLRFFWFGSRFYTIGKNSGTIAELIALTDDTLALGI
jgi:hypothetical protein